MDGGPKPKSSPMHKHWLPHRCTFPHKHCLLMRKHCIPLQRHCVLLRHHMGNPTGDHMEHSTGYRMGYPMGNPMGYPKMGIPWGIPWEIPWVITSQALEFAEQALPRKGAAFCCTGNALCCTSAVFCWTGTALLHIQCILLRKHCVLLHHYIYGDVYFVSVSRMGYQIHHGTFATEWLWKILFSRFAGGARAAHAPGACAGSFKRRFPAMSPSPATWLCPFHAGGYASLPPPSACRCQQNSCCEAPACMAVEVFRGAPPSKFPITETK